VTRPQRHASDPRLSAWVRANAGSGKTHVLTERVMRLLLAGIAPEEILCLTYTKAAAAEMRRRVSERLGEWALLDEAALRARLAEIEGKPPASATLTRARTLFARALETPGGLKINTIHAFCESVLHRFPLEAGVPFDFAVIEDVEARALVGRICEAVIAEGLRGTAGTAAAVETLFRLVSDFSINQAIAMALAEGPKLRRLLADRDGAKRRLRRLVGQPATETRAALLRRVADEAIFTPDMQAALFEHLPPNPARKGRYFSNDLWASRTQMTDPEERLAVFLQKDGSPYKDRCISKITDPALAAAIGNEHDRLAALSPLLRRATLVERSEALLDLVGAIVDRYEAEKRRRGWLDFDDLVERLAALLGRRDASEWVRYKLDAGITHILVDESQDTNAEQWRVVKALVEEFFAGDSAVERPRTVFAVGDEKQSIFSFQGADPTLFGETGRAFGAAALIVRQPFAEMDLHTSFRTLPAILTGVDTVFADPQLRAAALAQDGPVGHETARADPGGTIALWPPLRDEADAVDTENWPTEPMARLQRAPRRLAERIAGEIRGWLDAGRPLPARGRPVRAEDILILVQTRSALFGEIIRALAQRGIQSPGADRLPVTTHIAVLDLMALGDVLSNPADDLQLAALLRSPLFEVSEDELFAIAAGRPERQTLWRALEASALPSAREAFDRLRRWRGKLDFGRPFEFFAEVLYRDQGLKRFHARLGGEVDDVMVEFLELALKHEQSPAPSLAAFLAELRAEDISIKRDLAEPGQGVRVMTVHGAKGLEAPIVILADAASKPAPSLLPWVFIDAAAGLFVYASKTELHTAQTLPLREAAESAMKAEYWRKLYVGMTRAEDELYVTGYLTRQGRVEGTWYEAVERALAPAAEMVLGADGAPAALLYPAERPAARAESVPAAAVTRPGPLVLPPLPPPLLVPTVRPSSAGIAAATIEVLAPAGERMMSAEESRQAGIALHALLQHLGRVPLADREKVVEKALSSLLPDLPPARREPIGAKALSILGRPEFAALFGPASRAELPFLVNASQNGKPIRLAGRIDRLVVANGRLLVVDYKSDAVPPGTPSEVPASYLTQVGLYAHVASQLFPGLGVDAGILWTTMESLMILPDGLLRDATLAFTMR